MKGHRRKKSSVGPESLRGQGRPLGGVLCCQEGGSQGPAQASADWALPRNLLPELSGSFVWGSCLPKIVKTGAKKALHPNLHP